MSIFNHFKHLKLSQGQETALSKLEAFLASPVPVFMLKGYAGSGKTTILQGLVRYLESLEKNVVLMAPTGRAAKVIREKTGHDATTIHKAIYGFDELVEVSEGDSFFYSYKLRNNLDVRHTIFIVDEASMLSDAKSEGEFFRFGSGRLLSDLIAYTRIQYPDIHSKIIFVGDPCQLPPVGDNSSKAFDADYLKNTFSLESDETEMTEVMRQAGQTGILKAATSMRRSMTSGFFIDFNLQENGTDMFNPEYRDFLSTWNSALGSKIIIASRNKTCSDLNRQIRVLKFGHADLPLQKSDTVILGGNNYRKGVFNGEFAVVNNAGANVERRTINLKGKSPVTLVWRDVELIFPDSDNTSNIVSGKILENYLYGDNNLLPEEYQALYVDFLLRHPGLKPDSEIFRDKIINDPHFNALLIKYGYVVTCHKAQGGEWDNVFTVWDNDNMVNFNCFIDKQRRAGKTNLNFYRWAYTAVTRASKKLYALNPPLFNSYSGVSFVDFPVSEALDALRGASSEITEIQLDDKLDLEIKKFNLANQPIPLQDHFITLFLGMQRENILVTGWEKINYEIRVTFKRENSSAVFKTFINGRNEFKNPMVPMANLSPDPRFNEEITTVINKLPKLFVNRNSSQYILEKVEFDLDFEEKYPFTRRLFDDLSLLLSDTGIRIEGVEHLQYKERYSFKRNGETAEIDFEYNKNGFFGRVVIVPKATNSTTLCTAVRIIVENLKLEENAV
jgi:hypothetical protein